MCFLLTGLCAANFSLKLASIPPFTIPLLTLISDPRFESPGGPVQTLEEKTTTFGTMRNAEMRIPLLLRQGFFMIHH